MAHKVTPWTEEEAGKVVKMLRSFNDADAVAAVMDVPVADLDTLCKEAFGSTFEEVRAKQSSVGRAELRGVLLDQALNGNAKALDMLAREQLDMDPVKRRTAAPKKPAKQLEM